VTRQGDRGLLIEADARKVVATAQDATYAP
jgi:hypothetical protein